MTAIEYLDQQVKQLFPNAVGISIGDWNDKRTWKICLDDNTKIEAESIFTVFDKLQYDIDNPVIDPITALTAEINALKLRMTNVEKK